MTKKTAKQKIGVKERKTSGSGKVTNLKSWKKGQSGNLKGRPKKADCLTTLMREELEKVDPKDKEKRTHKELVVIATIELAKEGNSTALKEVWERMDGKVKEKLEINQDSTNSILLAKTLSRKELEELNERLEATAKA
ncbi:MAG: hypothetical protein IH937_13590 [Acidobacteria bacterium]|nr:hypothetical protein [Acidobacteriota bacterium]